jgi:hypothetical protein
MILFTAALLLASAGGGSDTPIEPLETPVVASFLATPEAVGLCADIGILSDQIDAFGVMLDTDASFIFEMAVSYWQDKAEEGYGDSAAMTVEAQTLFRAWIYDCGGRVAA